MAFVDPASGENIPPAPPELTVQPRNELYGLPADWLQKIRELADAASKAAGPRTEILPTILKLLIGNKPELLERKAYGQPITQGSGETLGVRPEFAGDVMDFTTLGLAAPSKAMNVARAIASRAAEVSPYAVAAGTRGAQEGILRWGGDPTLMYSHGLSKGLADPAGDPLKMLLNPSLAITGASRHRNPFGSDYGILVPKAGLGEEYSRIGNRDLYIGRSEDAPGGLRPSAEDFIAQMGLVPPPKTEGSSFYNWAERNPHTGQWQVKKPEDLTLPLANNPHNAAIFSSPEFQSFKDFEERAGGAGVLGANYGEISDWSDEADRLFRSWYYNKYGTGPPVGADWLKTLHEAARDTRRTRGDDEAKSLLEMFKTAPSEYGELKVGGRIPITGEHWAGAILKPDTYSRFEALLQNRGIPTVLSPSGDNKYGLIHDIASQMQQEAGPLKSAKGLEGTVGAGDHAPTFTLEAKRAGATGSPTFKSIGLAAQNAMEHPDFDGYTATFEWGGKPYKVDAETGNVFKVGETGLPLFNMDDVMPAINTGFIGGPPAAAAGLPKVKLGDLEAHVIGETGQSPHFYAHEQWAKHPGNSDFYPHVFTDDGDSYMLHSTGNVYALDAKGEKIKQGAAHPEPVFNVKPDHPKYSAPTETPIPQPAVGTAAHQAKAAILANQPPIGADVTHGIHAQAKALLEDYGSGNFHNGGKDYVVHSSGDVFEFGTKGGPIMNVKEPAVGGGEAPTLGESLAKAKAKAAAGGSPGNPGVEWEHEPGKIYKSEFSALAKEKYNPNGVEKFSYIGTDFWIQPNGKIQSHDGQVGWLQGNLAEMAVGKKGPVGVGEAKAPHIITEEPLLTQHQVLHAYNKMIQNGDFGATIMVGDDTFKITSGGQVYLKPSKFSDADIPYGMVKDIKNPQPGKGEGPLSADPSGAHHTSVVKKAQKMFDLGGFSPQETAAHFQVGGTGYKLKPDGTIWINEGDEWFIFDQVKTKPDDETYALKA